MLWREEAHMTLDSLLISIMNAMQTALDDEAQLPLQSLMCSIRVLFASYQEMNSTCFGGGVPHFIRILVDFYQGFNATCLGGGHRVILDSCLIDMRNSMQAALEEEAQIPLEALLISIMVLIEFEIRSMLDDEPKLHPNLY
jgi:hypothetical protein